MSIYLDISAAVHHRAGLGRYAESLTRALLPHFSGNLSLFYNREQGIEPLAGLGHLPTHTIALGYKPWRMLIWLGQLARVPFNSLIPGATLFHATEHLLMPLRNIPTVLTVHDLIFYHLPEHHKPLNRWYLNWTLPLYCRRATHIITVSEATRQDLIQIYHIPPEKITVILEAADPHFVPPSPNTIPKVRAKYGLPEHYLLYLATLEGRKNLTRLLHAWEPLYLAGEAPPLVFGGKRGWLIEDFFTAVERSPAREGILFTGYVAEEDLPILYAGALAFVFPSLYEGFGLPPLEAMACGTPVACSNAPPMPEVLEDAALLFEPTDVDAITDTLRRLVKDADLRAELRARGLHQAAQFSWERAARETAAIYRHLISPNG